MNANEQFLVRHYAEDEKPILKGHGFDGLVIGDDRQEAQEFVDYLNSMLRQQQAEIEALKKLISEMKYEKSSGVYEMNNEPVAYVSTTGLNDIEWTDASNSLNYGDALYTHPHPDNLGLAESIIKQQELQIEALKADNKRLKGFCWESDEAIEFLKAVKEAQEK